MPDWTHHGGRLSHAIAAYPQAPGPWLDLSTGINPDAWDGIDRLTIDWRRLPDEAELGRLEQVAALYFGAQEHHGVLALPGTEPGLRGLSALGLPAPFRHVAPGYRTHGEVFADSRAIGFPALEQEAAEGGTILLANPGNPDGRLLAVAELTVIAGTIAKSGGWLVVDEAFIDAHDGASILSGLDADAPVIVLRSFGKFFGLAGVRLGFAVGPQALIARWRAMLGSWPVSAAAIAIGTAAYGDAAWVAAMRQLLAERAAALDAVLVQHGLTPMGQSPLFRLLDCDAAGLFDQLARRAILTRPFDYASRWLRLGVPASAHERDRLGQALAGG